MNMRLLKLNLADFGGLFRSEPFALSDQELLSLDLILHRAWVMKRAGHQVFDDERQWDYPQLLEPHVVVRSEMERRGFRHAIQDELESETAPFLRGDSFTPPDPLDMSERRPVAILRAVVTRVEGSSAFFGFDSQNMKVPGDFLRSAGGKLYYESGSAAAGGIAADPGDVVEIECPGINVAKNRGGATSATAEPSRIIGMSKLGRPMTVGEAIKAAREAGLLDEREIAENGEVAIKGVRAAFGSYGGKRFLAHRIASHIPYHKLYVEPFAGGAAVLYAKDPSPKEVLNDRDPEIAFMHRFIKDHSTEDRQALAKRDWTIGKETHERLKKMKPETDRDRFYKSFYLTRSSYGKMRGGSFNHANAGVKIDFPANIERAQARLKNVAVSNKDYRDVLKEHDDPETFFYMDPPYPGKFNLFDFGFKHKEFLKAIKGLKANWIVSYPLEMAGAMKGWNVYRVKRRNQMKGPGGNKEWITEIMISKFPLKPLNLYIQKELVP